MSDSTLPRPRPTLGDLWKKIDKVWLAVPVIALLLAVFDPAQLWPTLVFAAKAIAHTGIFIVFAVLAVAYLKASGAEALVAKAFEGSTVRMIVLAALVGGLAPFCSCQVIPFIAAMLALGAPLAAVMAFWLSSPLMDPAMFFVTAGTLGSSFAIAKTVAAVWLGLFGGFATLALSRSVIFTDPLKPQQPKGCCSSKKTCGSDPVEKERPVWAFWTEAERRATFRETGVENALFLFKWLSVAYMAEALMLHYVPAEMVSRAVGGEGMIEVMIGALVGMPAYLNGFAAVPLVDSLVQQGMSQGAAMSFMLAGGVSCIPAALAVWALVKPRVFAAYLGLAFIGTVMAGMAWNILT